MQPVSKWLRFLAIEPSARTFEDNDINASVWMIEPSVQFKELAVSIGHHKNLVKVIARLKVFITCEFAAWHSSANGYLFP